MSNTAETQKAKATAAKPAVKKPAAKKQQPFMYVGPTIPGVAIQNRVYTEAPEALNEVKKAVPEFANLCIPVIQYANAERMIRERKGYIYSAYTKALQYREGGTNHE